MARASTSRKGLLPTPPVPADLPKIQFPNENARLVFYKRYVRKDLDGQPMETPEETFWRVAYHVAKAEKEFGASEEEVIERAKDFYRLLAETLFYPNSPTWTGAGTPLGQLAACFVLPISDDMGRKDSGIFMTLRNAALIQQTGGGNGFSFSRLRPKGTVVKSSAGKATGPVGFLRVYDHAFGEIAQGGCLLPETLVFTDRGLLRLDEIVDTAQRGWQEHDLHVPTDQGLRHSPRGYNNGVAPVLRVHTREGLSLAGTPDHKVKVMTPQGPQWRRLEDLRPGDWILVKLGEHRGRLQALRHPTRKHGNQVWPTLPAVLDEELAFFLGYFIGDGFLASREDDHRLEVTVAEDSYLVEEMPRLMERLFGVRVHRMQKRGDRSITFLIDNRAVKEFFRLNGFTKESSRTARVPRLIRLSPPNVVAAFLRGLFEADGTLTHGYPTLITTSRELAREVATLLIGLGAPVHVRTLAAGLDAWGQSTRYVVRIVSHVGLEAWRRRIGCDLRSRFVQAYAWQVDTRRESSYVLPHAEYWLAPVLEAITLPQIDRQGRGQGKKFRSVHPRLRRRLLRYTRGDRAFTLSAYRELREAYPEAFAHAPNPEGLWFVQVTGVESIGEHLTLDLEVEDNHTYLAYGMVTHNTRRGANMAVLRVDHPDVEEFITCKTDENAITNFNISVGITDAFMRAVENDEEWELVFPDVTAPEYDDFDGTLEDAREQGIPIKVYKKVRARDLFEKIARQAHHNGEPGVLFLDRANRDNPVPHQYRLEATNPCFVGETRIATAKGLIPIRELAESGETFTIVTDNRAPLGGIGAAGKTLGTRLRSGVRAFKTREQVPVFRLRTRKGYTVTATADHPFLTPDRGYVELQHLRPGDRVLLQSGEGAWSQDDNLPNQEALEEVLAGMALAGDRASGHLVQRRDFTALRGGLPRKWSHELGLVLGYLVGDGWLSESSNSPVGFALRSQEEVERIHGLLRGWFGEGHVTSRNSHYQVTYGRLAYEFFRALGVQPVRTTEKRVPEAIWRAPREAVVGFLQGLFSADGTVQVQPHKRDCTVRLASSSRKLLEDVQLLLLNFGIVSRIYRRRDAGVHLLPDGRGGLRLYEVAAQYELVIGRESRDRFAQVIGFANSEKQAKLLAFVDSQTRGPYRETFEDEIESIEPAGFADVYDLEEPETHSLIANGLVCHNCGEQWLGPYENCCLGSINLARHATPEGGVDWEKLADTVRRAVRFLDDVVQANQYVPAVPQLKEAAHRNRRIGLGIMGLADLMYINGIRYGSKEAQEFAAQIMEFIRFHAMKTSIELARERGPFPGIKGSIYDPENLKWKPPTWPDWLGGGPKTDWGRPKLDWNEIVEGIKKYGIRNAAQLTIAPTGTISTVSGVEGYGCEPVFALAYYRYVNDEDGKRIRLRYVSPLFMKALNESDLSEEEKEAVIQHVLEYGTIQNYSGRLPEHIRHTFVVAGDISAEEHVYMQAALQVFVDNSISKTINFPADATVEDVKKAYLLAWKLGCKGLTVYVTGSREKVVLETAATAKKKADSGQQLADSGQRTADSEQRTPGQLRLWPELKKPRPAALPGMTIQVNTPLGKAYVTINENGDGQPFEVFINTAKAGSETAAISEAIGRLISYILRLSSPVKPLERLKEIYDQLHGIGGDRSLGFGPFRIRSLPDGVAYAIKQYLDYKEGTSQEADVRPGTGSIAPLPLPILDDQSTHNGSGIQLPTEVVGELCPECGQAALINEEGCRKCYACGYSEC